MTTAAQTIARWSTNIALDDIPADVAHHAKLHVLDALGCGLAAHGSGLAGEGRATMVELGGTGDATVIGLSDRLPAANAAFANAMLCHGLDFDDTHSESVSHVSAVIAPAALAAGEALGSSGADVLAAIVAGNEVVCRVGMAAPGEFHRRGFHPTAICGIFGGVATVARLNGLDAETTTRALGIAGSFAGGLFAYLADGTPTKPMHPAWAAHGAHLAVALAAPRRDRPQLRARRQVRALPRLPRRRRGRGRHRRLSSPTSARAGRHRGSRTSRSPSATSCTARSVQRPTRAVGARSRPTRSTTCSSPFLRRVSRSCSSRRRRRCSHARSTRASSRSSTPSPRCSCAATSPSWTSPTRRSPIRRCLPSPARCATRPATTRPTRRRSPAVSASRSQSGKSFEGDLAYQKGGPENPLSDDEVREKFHGNAGLILCRMTRSKALADSVLALETQGRSRGGAGAAHALRQAARR